MSVNGGVKCCSGWTSDQNANSRDFLATAPACDFAERKIWDNLGGGWQCLYGCFCQRGLSVEWHDFTCKEPLQWSRSFHPCSIELCFNVSGHARLICGKDTVVVEEKSVALYATGNQKLSALRFCGERHRFLTVEFSLCFLRKSLSEYENILHPLVRAVLRGGGRIAKISPVIGLSPSKQREVDCFLNPPVSGAATAIWYRGKVLELMAQFFFSPQNFLSGKELREKEVSQMRIERVIEILNQRLIDPPSLRELGRLVGCSPYHLSRIFSKKMGITISQYLRQIRIERAAELLKSGKFNVTEAALEVGYNSISHFSQAFREVMGCCPGLYPLKMPIIEGDEIDS
ncbi:MAG: AraC family transcriptional regulator [Verrucomicrobiae bacterium]|nr:AraC family transcriptional regulator [Verrucomicrobiae bacterium]